ncbi:MAG TPA: hypothetical protein VK208_19955, partial [Pyrinomonadaceae bacterium]|nr:hypothetical protein [Pyrinomonadaceae bacterium]
GTIITVVLRASKRRGYSMIDGRTYAGTRSQPLAILGDRTESVWQREIKDHTLLKFVGFSTRRAVENRDRQRLFGGSSRT